MHVEGRKQKVLFELGRENPCRRRDVPKRVPYDGRIVKYRRLPIEGVRGDEPPMNIASPSDPRMNRRAINGRWLAATVIMAGTAGFLMLGALDIAFHGKIHFTAAVAKFLRTGAARIEQTVDGRGDRLDPLRPISEAVPTQVHVAQLDARGVSAKPLTHLAAHLGAGPAVPVATAVMVRRVESYGSADMQEESQASSNPLPPEILFGTSRRRRAAPQGGEVSLGYAEARTDYARVEPVNVSVVPKAVVHSDEVYKIIVAKAGDTLPLVLRAFGASEADAQAITARMSGWKVGKPGLFAGGEKITVVEDSFDRNDEKAAAKPLRVIVEGLSPQAAAVVLSDNGDYIGDVDLPHDASADGGQTHISAGDGASPGVTAEESVKDNLYALAKVNNVDRSLIDNVVRLCAHDIDLDEPASADDAVDLLYSAGETGEAELAYVGLTVDGKAHRYYRFTSPADSSSDYYDQNGHSITQFLLRKPVAAGRLGDGFGWRTHPVLHDRRFHEGVDYAAPYGSPIAAAGAGVVEKIDQEWGYGKYIRVRHDQGYETTYAHVSGFPRGVRVGARVRQGETIAYIGSTGLSTGPHLYYEVRINGQNVDPLRIRLEAGRLLSAGELTVFHQQREKLDQLIAASTAH